MAADTTVVIDVAGLQALIDLLRGDGWTVIGPTVADGVIGHARDHAPSTSCRAGSATSRTPPATGCASAATTRCSATRWGRSPGSRCCSRPASCSARSVAVAEDDAGRGPAEPRPLALLGVRSCDLHAIGDPRPGPAQPAARSTPTTPSAAREAFIVARHLRRPGRHLLLRVDGHRARAARGVRPRADRAARRRRPPVPRARRQPPGRRAAGPAARRTRRRTATRPRPPRSCDRRSSAHGPQPGHRRASATSSTPTPSTRSGTTSRAGAWRAATARWSAPPASAPRWRTPPTWRPARPSAGGCGTPASPASSPTCTAAASAPRRGRATGSGRPTSWPPGGTSSAASGCVGCGRCITWCPAAIDITAEVAALRATPATSAAHRHDLGGRDMRGIDELLREHPFFAGLDDDALALIAGCAANRHMRAGRVPLPRGRPGRDVLRHPARPGRPGGAPSGRRGRSSSRPSRTARCSAGRG